MNISEKSQKLIQKATKNHPNMKLTVAVYHKGQSEFKLFDKTGEIPYHSYFYEIGSITKVFTTSVLAKFVQIGKMHLDDSVANYFPELQQTQGLPTLKELATHTSGLNDWKNVNWKDGAKIVLNLLFKGDATQAMELLKMDRGQMLDEITHANLKKKGKWKYSNFGMALLGQAIAEVAGKSYSELMEDFFLELDLHETFMESEVDGMLQGFNMKGKPVANWMLEEGRDLYEPAGAVTSNAEDLLAFGKHHLAENPNYLKMTHEPCNLKSPHSDMGLGWWIDKKKPAIIYHGGNTQGYASMLALDKEKEAVVVLLSNVYYYAQREKLFEDILENL